MDAAVNMSSNLSVVDDDSYSTAVVKCAHHCVNCDESKYNANVGVKVSSSNVCIQSTNDVNHISEKFV